MKSTITVNHPPRSLQLPRALCAILPTKVLAALQAGHVRRVEEIRLRVGYGCSISCDGDSRSLPGLQWSREDMDALLLAAGDGSGYALRSCLDRGYIPLPGGVRIGVCGCATDSGAAGGALLWRVDSVNIRIPARFAVVGRGILPTVRATIPRGTLFYAPPAVGKTTLLRALTSALCEGEAPLRVVMVDSRRELDDGAFSSMAMLDILSGYPKREGIEIAARTMSAQVIVCDELGSNEARAVLSAALCGVPLLASAHAGNLRQLLARPELRVLHSAGAFGCYVGLQRGRAGEDYMYTVTAREEVHGV